MKKDKKWFVDKWTKERDKTDVHDPMYHFINEFIEDVNQLDEPEVLSQEWIVENRRYTGVHDIGYYIPVNKLYGKIVSNKKELDQAYKDGYDKGIELKEVMNMEYEDGEFVERMKPLIAVKDNAVSVENLQNLLVPNQELPVVIPKYVADWIEEMKQDERPLYSAMSSLLNKTNREWANWKRTNKNFSEIVAQAWLDGYEVEEEPLYYALIKGHELIDSGMIYWVHDKNNDDVFISVIHSPSDNFLAEMSKEEWNKLGINDSNADFINVAE